MSVRKALRHEIWPVLTAGLVDTISQRQNKQHR